MEIPSLTPDMIIDELMMKKISYGCGNPSYADKFLHDKGIFDIFSVWDPSSDDDDTMDILRTKISIFMRKETQNSLNWQIWN